MRTNFHEQNIAETSLKAFEHGNGQNAQEQPK